MFSFDRTRSIFGRKRTACAFASALLVSNAAIFQPTTALADVTDLLKDVPADAALVVGFNGFDDEDPAFANSKLASFLEDSDLINRITKLTTALQAAAEDEMGVDLGSDEAFSTVTDTLQPLAWKTPNVFYFNGVDLDEDGVPIPSIGWVVELKSQAHHDAHETLRALIEEQTDDADADLLPFHCEQTGDRLVLTIGQAAIDAAALHANGDAEASNKTANVLGEARFTEAMASVQSQTMDDQPTQTPSLFVYADVPKLSAMVQNIVQTEEGPEAAHTFKKVMGMLGLDGVDRVAYAAGFQGDMWHSSFWLEAPSPRRGLLSLLEQQTKTIPTEALTVTSPNSTWIHVVQFNALDLATKSMGLISQIAEDQGEPMSVLEMNAKIGEALAQAGLPQDFHLQLLTGLGSNWTVYSDPMFGPSGMVLVSKLNNGPQVDQALNTLKDLANQMLMDEQVPFQISDLDLGNGTVIHALQVPMFAPAWTVHEGHLIVAGSAQTAMAAIENMGPDAGSILDAPRFKQTMAKAGLDPAQGIPGGFMYADLKRTAMGIYQTANMLVNLAAPYAMEEGIDIRGVMPPLSSLLNNLEPAVSHSHVDATGYHSWTLQPFPFSTLASGEGLVSMGSGGGAAMTVGIMLPALQAARQAARKMQSSSNLRGIHQCAFTYANGNREKLPPNLQVLVDDEYLTRDYLISPRDPEPDLHQSSYVYLQANQAAALNATTIFAFEHPRCASNDRNPGISVAFMDNHVEFMPLEQAEAMVLEQTGKTLDEWAAAAP